MGNSNSNNNNIKNDKITKNYFSFVNKILKQKNIKNFSLIDNLKICLNEKNFDQVSNTPVQYFSYELNEEPTQFINWLDFIYDYLSKEHSHERYWALQMIEQLDNEDFIYENKYLSEFFMEEFEIENQPKCIQIEKIKNEKLNLNNSTLNITQNLGGSFGTTNSGHSSEDIDFAELKYKTFRQKVKKYIIKFKQHILNKDHPINRVVQIFEKIWVAYTKVKINLIEQNYNNYNDKNNIKLINKQVNELTYQLQRFVIHLQISLKLFYSRTINYSCFNEEKDELINIVTTLVFRTGEIYNTIFELYKLSLIPEINNMTNCLQKLIKITPEELGVSKKFCLDKKTLDYQEEILINELNKNKNKNKNKSKDIKNDEINTNSERTESRSSINKNLDFRQNEDEIEKNNINTIIALVRENKKKCPKYGDREMEETKVNLDYEENFNLILANSIKKENELNNNSDNALLPTNEIKNEDNSSINSYVPKRIPTYSNKLPNINDSIDSSDSIDNIDNTNISKDEEYYNKNLIIRTTFLPENEKNLIPTKIEKIFNRVEFIRTKNIEYLSYPYETAIQLLKQIKKYKTPFEKMMIIASISNEITECINDFWKNLSNYIDNSLLNLEIDQLMTIFIYIIIKSQIYDISVHCKIIKSFTTCITKASMIGYYYSTVEASVSYIQTIDNINQLIKNKIQ